MLHTKFRPNRSTGSGEDSRRVFTIYWHGGHLGHLTQMPRKTTLWLAKGFQRKYVSIVNDGRTSTSIFGTQWHRLSEHA